MYTKAARIRKPEGTLRSVAHFYLESTMPDRRSVSGYEEGKDVPTRDTPLRQQLNAEEVKALSDELAEATAADTERRAREEAERRALGES